jgi:hypothetical protein
MFTKSSKNTIMSIVTKKRCFSSRILQMNFYCSLNLANFFPLDKSPMIIHISLQDWEGGTNVEDNGNLRISKSYSCSSLTSQRFFLVFRNLYTEKEVGKLLFRAYADSTYNTFFTWNQNQHSHSTQIEIFQMNRDSDGVGNRFYLYKYRRILSLHYRFNVNWIVAIIFTLL